MTTTDAKGATDTPLGYAGASTRRVVTDNAIEYAYRDTGDSAVPLVLLQHFRGNLDNWDPALVDALAAERRVITFPGARWIWVGLFGAASSAGATCRKMSRSRGRTCAEVGFLPDCEGVMRGE